MESIFVTGTDTGVGKTIVTGMITRFMKEKGINAVPQKWVQTGCYKTSEDTEKHLKLIGCDDGLFAGYIPEMSPYILKYPASPHLASAMENINIDPYVIKNSFMALKRDFEMVIAEGSGGVLVPLNTKDLMIDIAADIGLHAVIVSENRLGAINQTLLTIEAVCKRGMKILGVIFNRLSEGTDAAILEDNMDIVENISGEKVLGEIRYNEDHGELYSEFMPLGEKIFSYLNNKPSGP